MALVGAVRGQGLAGARLSGPARLSGRARLSGPARFRGPARLGGPARLPRSGSARGPARLGGPARLSGPARSAVRLGSRSGSARRPGSAPRSGAVPLVDASRIGADRPGSVVAFWGRGSSSVGRASAFQAECREFEPRLPLQHLPASSSSSSSSSNSAQGRSAGARGAFEGRDGLPGNLPERGPPQPSWPLASEISSRPTIRRFWAESAVKTSQGTGTLGAARIHRGRRLEPAPRSAAGRRLGPRRLRRNLPTRPGPWPKVRRTRSARPRSGRRRGRHLPVRTFRSSALLRYCRMTRPNWGYPRNDL